eukprot:SAG11_NODE_15_length_26319_cov_13.810564_9_plen_177_part_00
MEERTKEVLGGLQLIVQEARAAVGRWQRRVMAAEDSDEEDSDEEDDDLMFYVDDMLAAGEEWLKTCSWVLAEAQAALGAGRPGQFWELGATLVEEAAEGATTEDLNIFVWAVVGEPPAVAVGEREDIDIEAEADEAEAEAGEAEADEAEAKEAEADEAVEAAADEAKAEAAAAAAA